MQAKHEHEMLRKMVRKFAEDELLPQALKRDEEEYFDLFCRQFPGWVPTGKARSENEPTTDENVR